MDLSCKVVFFSVFVVVLFAVFILLPLFYSNDQLQKQLNETRKTLKYKEEIIHDLSTDKKETFTR